MIFFYIFFYIYKNVNKILYKKEKAFKKGLCNACANLSEEEKDKRGQYPLKQYRNLSEGEKEKNPQYGRKRYTNLLEMKNKG